MPSKVLKKMLNTQPINHACLVLVVALQKVLNLLNVNTALGEEKLEQTKVFLQFNKHVHSVVAMVKRLENHVAPVVVTARFRPMKM